MVTSHTDLRAVLRSDHRGSQACWQCLKLLWDSSSNLKLWSILYSTVWGVSELRGVALSLLLFLWCPAGCSRRSEWERRGEAGGSQGPSLCVKVSKGISPSWKKPTGKGLFAHCPVYHRLLSKKTNERDREPEIGALENKCEGGQHWKFLHFIFPFASRSPHSRLLPELPPLCLLFFVYSTSISARFDPASFSPWHRRHHLYSGVFNDSSTGACVPVWMGHFFSRVSFCRAPNSFLTTVL